MRKPKPDVVDTVDTVDTKTVDTVSTVEPKRGRPLAKRCRRGHLLNDSTTYKRKDGKKRDCKLCAKRRASKSAQQKEN